MNYDDALSWVDGFHQHGIRLGLDRIQQMLELLGNPQQQVSFIHVAGTNGKGSVCRFISSILTREGYHVGLYLSPHLIDFRERIQLNNEYISKQDFSDIVSQIKPVVEKYCRDGNWLTYFEVCTIIALQFFAKQHLDYAVIEVGLGGRYDATNVITPLVSVITNVSLDHQHHLGDTVKEIADEKAGIIKSSVPVVTAAKGEALKVIRKKCKQKHSPLTEVNKEMIIVHSASSSQQILTVQGIFDQYLLTTAQTGIFQQENIVISIATIELLQQQGIYISKESIIAGIKEIKHPGRMQIIHQHPTVVVDGAHNPDALVTSIESIQTLFSYQRLIVIFGVMKDKAIAQMISLILPLADIVILTQPKIERAASSNEMKKYLQSLDYKTEIIETKTVEHAYHTALDIANENDLIFATGSLFTVAEILQKTTEK